MGMRNGPNELLQSLSELRPGDAKRRYRRSIFEDFPTRGRLVIVPVPIVVNGEKS
jgi:hypothetical protein